MFPAIRYVLRFGMFPGLYVSTSHRERLAMLWDIVGSIVAYLDQVFSSMPFVIAWIAIAIVAGICSD